MRISVILKINIQGLLNIKETYTKKKGSSLKHIKSKRKMYSFLIFPLVCFLFKEITFYAFIAFNKRDQRQGKIFIKLYLFQ